MKYFLIIIIIIPLLPLIVEYSEISIKSFDTIDENEYLKLKKKGFFPSCMPKEMKNVTTVWDMDTNDFYMQFDMSTIEFYSFDDCSLINRSQVIFPKQFNGLTGYIKTMFLPGFVTAIEKESMDKNMKIYQSYIEDKIPFYILLNSKTKKGFAFQSIYL